MICPATLPKPGDKVDIGMRSATVLESQPALQTGLYGGRAKAQALPPGFDGGCTLQVQYADGTTDTVSAAEVPEPLWAEYAELAIFPAYLGLIFLPSGSGSAGGYNAYDDFTKEYEDLLADHEKALLADAPRELHKELSGEYWGASDESDAGDQAIRVHLRLSADGRISGRGRDDADGSYKVKGGRWAMAPNGKDVRLAWKEVYDEGFVAICFGEYKVKSGKVEADFASSRGVSGSFMLAKKPSVF